MPELREQFGSMTYTVIFSMAGDRFPPPGLAICRNEDGTLACTARNIRELNEYTGMISEWGGKVERIESRYPSLEEILVRIGK